MDITEDTARITVEGIIITVLIPVGTAEFTFASTTDASVTRTPVLNNTAELQEDLSIYRDQIPIKLIIPNILTSFFHYSTEA